MSEELERLAANVLAARVELMDRLLDPRRDLDKECGYPDTGSVTAEQYRSLYDRNPIASRVVEVLPMEAWQVHPAVAERGSRRGLSPFRRAWEELQEGVRGDKSWFRSDSGSPVWEVLRRADVMSGVGSFGVVLLGFDDGKTLEQPLDGVASSGRVAPLLPEGTDAQYMGPQLAAPQRSSRRRAGRRKLLFMRVFDESLAYVSQYDSDQTSPRFGQPLMYRLTFNDPREQRGGVGLPIATVDVHWTRVLHLADGVRTSTVFGVPRMRPVLNRLMDLDKLYGGSAEMFWRGAAPGFSFETLPQLGGSVRIDHEKLEETIWNYMNGLQRHFVLMGMTAKPISPQVADPSAHIAVHLEAVCVQLAIPKRVFMGSERGEMASSQDDSKWNDVLRGRQNMYLTPRVVAPFVDRCIAAGALPEPDRGLEAKWPDLESLSDADRAQLASTRTATLAAYVSGNLSALVSPLDFLVHVFGLHKADARRLLRGGKPAPAPAAGGADGG